MNARQKAKYYKKKYEELSHRQSNNSFIVNAAPSFPFEPNLSMLSYHVGNCPVSKLFFSDADPVETFKHCRTMMEEKNDIHSM